MWIQQEIRGGPTCRMWRVPILNSMGIEELSCVVSAISSVLKPDREVILIETLRNKFWVAACSIVSDEI